MANIIITGANQGIGYYLVEQALKDGNHISVLDLETNNLESLSQFFPGCLIYYKVDVCDENRYSLRLQTLLNNFIE